MYMGVTLRVRSMAEAQGHTISSLQRQANITMSAARRYWYGSRDGTDGGPALTELDLRVLGSIAGVLGVGIRDVLSEDGLALLAAMG
jgi:hypothetical protein